MKLKHCGGCGRDLSTDAFHRNKTKPDGLATQCKECVSAWKRTHYEANKDRILARQQDRYEADKDQILARCRDYRRANKERISARDRAYREANKERVAVKNRTWREANREREKTRRRRYYTANRDRIHACNAAYRRSIEPPDSETVEWMKLIRLDPCSYCEAPGPSQIDHVVPVSKGGRNHWTNLTAACQRCNDSKWNRLLLQWLCENR